MSHTPRGAYWQATEDHAFLLDAGAEILLETARFWASRVTRGADGRYHLLGVTGPDEYHKGVDDNAYTNVLARWNLMRALGDRYAAAPTLARAVVGAARTTGVGRRRAGCLAGCRDTPRHGADPATGLIEQFAGYFGLEYIDLATFPPHSSGDGPLSLARNVLARARSSSRLTC